MIFITPNFFAANVTTKEVSETVTMNNKSLMEPRQRNELD